MYNEEEAIESADHLDFPNLFVSSRVCMGKITFITILIIYLFGTEIMILNTNRKIYDDLTGTRTGHGQSHY